MNNPLLPHEAVILSRRQETADTWTLSLSFKEEALQKGYRFEPGQFNMVGIWGIGEAAISLSSPDAAGGTFLHTLRGVGGLTRSMVALEEGESLWIRGPYGRSWPMGEMAGKDLLCVAGGIGLAPLRPVIEAWIGRARKERGTGSRLILLYGARTPGDLLFREDFDRWSADPSVEILPTVDRQEGEGTGRYPTGLVTARLDDVRFDPERTLAFLCGPEIMMRLAALALRKRGIPPRKIHVSLERHMDCAVGQCGHCLFGPYFVCKDGPVFSLDRLERIWGWGM
jgi:NAD(P)H-flavin reductase